MFDFSEEIPISSDHAGFCLKTALIKKLTPEGYKFTDLGCYSEDSVDYPDFTHPLAKEVNDGRYRMGIIICGSANGVAMVANKYTYVRAAVCWTEEIARLGRMHNDANIIALPARFISTEEAANMVKLFFTTEFEGGRHLRRIQKIPVSTR